MASNSHFTTRRRFIATMGFGGVSLYGLWAAYGAAPGPLTLLGLGHDAHADITAGGHGGHGATTDGPSFAEFNRLTMEFIERYRLPDGTVHPRVLAQSAPDGRNDHGRGAGEMDHGGMDHGGMVHGGMDHGGMDHGATDPEGVATDHGASDHGSMRTASTGHGTPEQDHAGADHRSVSNAAHGGADAHAHDDDTLEVYLAAGMWYYQPARLRLDAGQPYRFKLMATDVSHGASIQFGRGGRIVRLRPGRLTEMALTFHEPGRYLVYCTVYCGPAHDIMQATIEVV